MLGLILAVQMLALARGDASLAFQAQHHAAPAPTPRSTSTTQHPSTQLVPRSGSASSHPEMVPALRSRVAFANEQVGKLRGHGWLQLKLGEATDWLAERVNSLLTALGRSSAFQVDEMELRKIMRKMIMHQANATIQVEACMALRRLSINATAKVTITAAGGIERVLSAMARHSGDADVQYAALATLSSLASGNEDNAKQIAEAGNINTVLGAMLRHRDVADVQYFACEILKQVSENNDNAERIIKSGGIGLVAAAVGGHAQHSAVQEVAMKTLWHLTKAGSSRTLSDDLGSIIAAMREHAAHRYWPHVDYLFFKVDGENISFRMLDGESFDFDSKHWAFDEENSHVNGDVVYVHDEGDFESEWHSFCLSIMRFSTFRTRVCLSMTRFCMLLARFGINGAVVPVINGKVQDLHHHGTTLTQAAARTGACSTVRARLYRRLQPMRIIASTSNETGVLKVSCKSWKRIQQMLNYSNWCVKF